MKTCENCGSRVYSLGCVSCDEENYIAEQESLTAREYPDYDPTPWCTACGARTQERCKCGPIAAND